VKYELGFYIPEDGIFIATAVKTLNSYITYYRLEQCLHLSISHSILLQVSCGCGECGTLPAARLEGTLPAARLEAVWDVKFRS
jgi:hypothetical protein